MSDMLIDQIKYTLKSFSENRPFVELIQHRGILDEYKDGLRVCLEEGEEENLMELLELHERVVNTIEYLDNYEPAVQNNSESNEYDDSSTSEEEKERKKEKKEKILNYFPSEQFECPICFEETEPHNGHILSTCMHTYCQQCLLQHVTMSINSGEVLDLKCPNPTCGEAISLTDLQTFATAELMQKYDNLSLIACLKGDSEARWCPWEGCGIPIIGENPDNNQITCPGCDRKYCYLCSQKWHQNSTCLEASKAQVEDDPKTKKWKKRHRVKQCPHCGLDTIRESGCPSMVCANCSKHWNWYHDEAEQWSESGLYRKDESKLEQAAFMYPRLVKQAVGSREAAEMEPEEKAKFFAFIGALGIAGVPATLVCGIPAVAIRGARKVKHRFGRKD